MEAIATRQLWTKSPVGFYDLTFALWGTRSFGKEAGPTDSKSLTASQAENRFTRVETCTLHHPSLDSLDVTTCLALLFFKVQTLFLGRRIS